MAKRHLRKGRVVLAMAAVSLAIMGADHVRRDLFQPEANTSIVVSGTFKEQSAPTKDTGDAQILGNPVSNTTEFTGMQNVGFSETTLSSSALSTGNLAFIDSVHPIGEADHSEMVNLMDAKNEFYTLVDDTVMLNEEAADALNSMMADYTAATGLVDFIVYGTTKTYTGPDSFCPEKFPESVTGNTVDFAINGYASVLPYDGRDEEGWVVDNCEKYGFIVRYPQGKENVTGHEYCPWHLRYVGKVHAAIMAEKNLCFDEYIKFLKDYTYNKPFKYSINEVNYEIYSTPSTGELTTVMIPVSGNYDISGDNMGNFIITAIKD
ncbi:MAG: M15 family metallopeptidase [Ruminococcus sp.]|nr:M15 family metallopeptidase [Ruminococcus sp.]